MTRSISSCQNRFEKGNGFGFRIYRFLKRGSYSRSPLALVPREMDKSMPKQDLSSTNDLRSLRLLFRQLLNGGKTLRSTVSYSPNKTHQVGTAQA